jgi:hypothetical protein
VKTSLTFNVTYVTLLLLSGSCTSGGVSGSCATPEVTL